MEIKYRRNFVPQGKNYSVGEIGAMLGYALEIIEPRARLSEGKLGLGESAMILFGITPEEYEWCQNDIKSLNLLAEQIRKEIPADRLIGYQILDIKGMPVARGVKLATGNTIDGGAFQQRMLAARNSAKPGPCDAQLIECRRLQKICAEKDAGDEQRAQFEQARLELAAAMRELDSWYVVYDALLNEKWPLLGFDGRIEIFTDPARADACGKQIVAMHAGLEIWKVREVKKVEREAFFRLLAENGIVLLRVDNGFAAAELSLRDFGRELLEMGVELRSLMLREASYGMRLNKLKEINAPERNVRSAAESMLTMRSFAMRNIGNGILYAVAIVPQYRPEGLCTQNARAKLGEAAARMHLCVADKCAVVSDNRTKQGFLAVFTSAKRAMSFASKMKGMPGAAQSVAMTFDELAARAENLAGMLIDFENIGYRLPKPEFAKVLELRAKPPTVVRIKNEEAPAAAPSESALPDPDLYAAPEKEVRPEVPAEKTETGNEPDDPAPKKGFLKKIFGGKK